MKSDFRMLNYWTTFSRLWILLDIHKPFGYFPKILLLNENVHSPNSIFTSSLFLRVVAGAIKKRLTMGQHLEKQVCHVECQGTLWLKQLKHGRVVLDFFPQSVILINGTGKAKIQSKKEI